MTPAVPVPAAIHAAARSDLRNGYFRLSFKETIPSALEIDPTGQGRHSLQFARDLRPDGWTPAPSTHLSISDSRAALTSLDINRDDSRRVEAGASRPDALAAGHTLAQSFTVSPPSIVSSVAVKLPTWHTVHSGATISLLREGAVLAVRRVRDVPDNSWQRIDLPRPAGAGRYTIMLSDPTGTIGWWSGGPPILPAGQAAQDSAPAAGDRAVDVEEHTRIGSGDLTFTLHGSTMRVTARIHQTGSAPAALGWTWQTSWTKHGYDVTPRAGVVFSRFFSDNQRYMPVEQLKRRSDAGLSFDGCRWIEMDGSLDADMRIQSPGLHLDWGMTPSTLSLRFSTPEVRAPDGAASSWDLLALPYRDQVPAEFPRFTCSDAALQKDLNRFWWERAFTYPAPAGNAAWFEWLALERAPYAGPLREGQVNQLRTYPIDQDGYVHTWGSLEGWPFPSSPPYDTRHSDTNARFILACWRYYLFTGDRDFLRSQAARLRKAMQFQLDAMHGKDGLILAVSKDITGRHRAIGDNYWDILPFGHLDAYVNIVFYASLTAMQQMDSILGETPLIDYGALRRKTHRRYDDVFWDEAAGRYIGCVDADGVRHDYGFTFVNLEALYYGLGDVAKARRIYHWMEHGITSSGKADTYSRWIFAPRANTIHNPEWTDSRPGGKIRESDARARRTPEVPATAHSTPPWWMFGWHGTPYGDQCQDGGAILYTSYYDLMTRLRHSGIENAWGRFMKIMGRYRLPDRLCGGDPLYLGEHPQQENPGSVGLDLPFPESGLVPCFFLYGVVGVEAAPAGLLIRPHLPRGLSYAGVEGINWHGRTYSIRVTRSVVEVRRTGGWKNGAIRRYRYTPGRAILIASSGQGE